MKTIFAFILFITSQSSFANNCTIYNDHGGLESRLTKSLAECASRAVTLFGTEGGVAGKKFSKNDPIQGKFVFEGHNVAVLIKPVQKAHHSIPANAVEKK